MAKSKTHHKKKHHHKKNSKKTHGGNAANWVEQVVGPYPHSAQSNGTNLIQQHVPAANIMSGGGSIADGAAQVDPVVNSAVPPVIGSAPILLKSGGKNGKKRPNKRKGGDVLAELAVPALLLVANQRFGRKTGRKNPMGRKRFSRRFRKGRR